MVALHLDEFPFSRRESNWSLFTHEAGPLEDGVGPELDQLTLRYVFGGDATPVYEIRLLDGVRPVGLRYEASPTRLVLRSESDAGNHAEIIMPRERQMRIRTRGCGLELKVAAEASGMWEALLPLRNERFQPKAGGAIAVQEQGKIVSYRAVVRSHKHDIHVVAGTLETDPQWGPKEAGSRRHQFSHNYTMRVAPESEILIVDYLSEPPQLGVLRPFDDDAAKVAAEFAAWAALAPPVAEKYRETAIRAAYVNWASIVPAFGNFNNPTMLMSKRRMNNAWNWDNYFNSWGVSLFDPDLAWQMYQLHFDHQDPNGALADGINEYKIGWTYTKPPVHGLVLSKILEQGKITDGQLESIYPKLVRSTEWWFRFRDDDGDMICQYHHGNDSGWDDASLFDIEPPVESPDLSALLVVQLRVLAQIADRLGRPVAAADHRERAEKLLAAFLRHSVRDNQFVALQDTTHAEASRNSLLLRVPMVLGSLLPKPIAESLVADLSDEKRFLGAHGIATEAMDSERFLPEGYWRGPSWAPEVMLIVHGLIDAGYIELARTIATRFCDTCVSSGFAECFNAQTGGQLHDRGYTWTSSIFLILADWLARSR